MTRLTEAFMRALQRFETTGELAPLLAMFDDEAEALNLGRTEPARGTDQVAGFWRDYRAMRQAGVRFVREPKEAAYGIVAVFEDLYGNRWDLVQLAKPASASELPAG